MKSMGYVSAMALMLAACSNSEDAVSTPADEGGADAAETAIRAADHAGVNERDRLGESVRERLHFEGMERFASYYSERVLLTEYFM